MLLTGCVSSLSAQQSFWKEDFSAGKLPDGWMIVDSTKSAKCEWIVTDQPYPGSFQFEQQAISRPALSIVRERTMWY